MRAESLQSCYPMGCSKPRFSDRGILQARILEWAGVHSSRGPSRPGGRIHASCIGRWALDHQGHLGSSGQGEEIQAKFTGSLSWGDRIEILKRPTQPAFSRSRTTEERRNCSRRELGDLQKLPLEYSAEDWSAHPCEKTTPSSELGKNHSNVMRGNSARAHTARGTVPIPGV